jgi:hypothetical protein
MSALSSPMEDVRLAREGFEWLSGVASCLPCRRSRDTLRELAPRGSLVVAGIDLAVQEARTCSRRSDGHQWH